MRLGARVRFVLARHRWIHRAAIAAAAASTALVVHDQLAAIERQRDAWGASRSVLVAVDDQRPGEAPRWHRVELPVPMVPAAAIDVVPDGARLRQHVRSGEVLVDADVIDAAGPAARAAPGTVVVAVVEPLRPEAAIGLEVRVAADGEVIADDATIVEVGDEMVYVAVDEAVAADVAFAAREDAVSLLYVP